MQYNLITTLTVNRKKGKYTVVAHNCGHFFNYYKEEEFSFTVVKRKHKLAREASEYADDESDD